MQYKINKEYNITILLITHEMSVIREICNKVAVMEGGCVVEQGSVFEVFAKPQTDIAKNFVRTVLHDEIPQSFLKSIGSHIPIIWVLLLRNKQKNKKVLTQKQNQKI